MTEIENQIWIEEDILTVFEITNNISQWKNLFSEYEESEVLEQKGSRIKFRLKTKKDEEGLSYSWISERVINRKNFTCVALRRDPLYPFAYMLIQWSYRPYGEGTLMTWKQKFEMDKSLTGKEAAFRDMLNRGTREQMKIIKEKIEKNGRKDNYEAY